IVYCDADLLARNRAAPCGRRGTSHAHAGNPRRARGGHGAAHRLDAARSVRAARRDHGVLRCLGVARRLHVGRAMALDVETPTTSPAGAAPPGTEALERPATPRTITATRSGPLPVLVHGAPLGVPAREPAAPEALPESPVPDAVRPPR